MMTLTNFAFLKKSDGFKSLLLPSWSVELSSTVADGFSVFVTKD